MCSARVFGAAACSCSVMLGGVSCNSLRKRKKSQVDRGDWFELKNHFGQLLEQPVRTEASNQSVL